MLGSHRRLMDRSPDPPGLTPAPWSHLRPASVDGVPSLTSTSALRRTNSLAGRSLRFRESRLAQALEKALPVNGATERARQPGIAQGQPRELTEALVEGDPCLIEAPGVAQGRG